MMGILLGLSSAVTFGTEEKCVSPHDFRLAARQKEEEWEKDFRCGRVTDSCPQRPAIFAALTHLRHAFIIFVSVSGADLCLS